MSPKRMMTIRLKRSYRTLLLCGCASILFLFLYMSSGCPPQGCTVKDGPFIHVRQLTNRQWSNRQNKTILRWTGFFDDSTWEHSDDRYFQRCKVKNCHITDDKNQVDNADAVLFHAGATFNFWRGISWPASRQPHQVWIMYNVEPPPRTPLNFARLNGVFNWTSFYRMDSDVPVMYGGYVKYGNDMQGKYTNSSRSFFKENPRLAAWMSSNCYDYGRRLLFMNQVKGLLDENLDMYGKCGVRRCPHTICRDTIANYKFFFTIENCICKDYVTEKFWEALKRQQVPVVLGGANYKKIAPPNSFVNAADFKDVQSLVDHLNRVGNDDTAYNKYLEWTKSYDIYGELEARRLYWCDLCEALHDKQRPAQVYDNLDGWVNEEPTDCPQWTLGNQVGRWLDGWKINWGLM